MSHHQSQITTFFKSLKSGFSPEPGRMEKKATKRKLSFIRQSDIENIIVLSSDEDDKKESIKTEPFTAQSQNSNEDKASDSSSQTILYSLTPESPKRNSIMKDLYTKSPSTNSKSTPSSSKKYFSPNKKRSVHKRPQNFARNLADEFATEETQQIPDVDEPFLKACEGQDDKTKFLLNIVNNFLKSLALKALLDENSQSLLSSIFSLPPQAARLVCRLYWRREGWYRRDQLADIGNEEKNGSMDDPTTTHVLNCLVEKGFFESGTNQNLSFNDFTSILRADEIKEICKDLKLKTQSKKSAIESLQDFCRRSSISCYFGNSNIPSNGQRALQIMSQKAGPCHRLSSLARNTLDRLYLLSYLGIDYDVIREKRLELMLINDKINRETFPIDKNMKLDDASVVFEDKDEFDRYYCAHLIYEDFITSQDVEERCRLVEQTLNMYKNMEPLHIVKYKSLPLYLQRFTPASKFVKVLELGLTDLKRGKSAGRCMLAEQVLTTLIAQTFREHRKAEWYAEKALVQQAYLNKPEEAATTLIAGFESELSDEAKDAMRPRARKIAQQKNIDIDESLRQSLLTHATKEYILESNIPSQHFYKQPMDNITKGKALYETKRDGGRVVQGVEEYALSCYLLTGEYTSGGHWEGRIITTIFFLLFWEIIYSKPKDARGVFLSYYQKYPLDMFCEDFYNNRREAIEKRLLLIETCSGMDVVDIISLELENRPESELSGICRDIPAVEVEAAAACLGGSKLASICRRLATDFRYWHSGFPDLTLIHKDDKKVKFVEVKSDNDKPSMKQIQWMQFLLEVGVETEFCYVGVNTMKPKSRQKAKTTPTKQTPKKKAVKKSVKLKDIVST